MAVLPGSRLARIEWFEQRLANWAANAAAIGLNSAQVIALQQRVTAARTGYNGAQQSRNGSKASTVTFHTSEDEMADLGRDLIKTIKAFAETSNDPNVYALAEVPPPAPPTPAGPPDAPTDLRGSINNDGAVELKWEGTLSHRTFYEVYRRAEGESAWSFIASMGAKSFLDDTLASGCSAVLYRVRAKRGDLVSESADPILIRLGVEPVGAAGAGAQDEQTPQLGLAA